jgi:glycosyltransferase involved in cell wall biosynthesis
MIAPVGERRAKVLAVAQAAELGGAEYALLRIARRLPERGFEVEIATPGRGAVADAADRDGIPVHALAVGALRGGAWPRAVVGWPRARRLMRRRSPDLVYLNGTVAQRLAPAFAGVTLVPHVHDLLDLAPRPWRSERFWRSVPVVLCDSEAVARTAAAVGAPPDRLRTVFCPIDAVEAAPRPDWADGRPVVGYVGRIEPRKGTLDLIRAARMLSDRIPDVRLVLVGDDDFAASAHYRSRVHREAEALGERVVLTGTVHEASRLMRWFDVLCVPSRREPFGTVAAEALAAGTPVVATRSGGMAEYVVPGRNGALVAPGEPEGLAEALAFVLERAQSMSGPALEDAKRFASDRVADLVAAALREALVAGPDDGRKAG